MSNVFVSHSSQNAWLIHGLVELIRMADPQATVFCSSEASIQPGANYKEAIYESLRNADLFVAIVSREYWASRYCILELGAAYERYCFDELKVVSIQPMLVPPLDKGLALANTTGRDAAHRPHRRRVAHALPAEGGGARPRRAGRGT